MRPLTTAEYDALQLRILKGVGLDESQARSLLALRWPQLPATVVVECLGRGAIVDVLDVVDFLKHIGCDPLEGPWLFNGNMVDAFLEWAVANDRVRPTEVAKAADRDPGRLKAMLEASTFPQN